MSIRKVSVAILSWNGRQHLEHCLPALRDQTDPGVATEVLVLDNGSWDDTSTWVRKHHPEVRLIRSEINHGFCGGNNRLVDEADGDAVVLLNNDTRPQRDWLAALTDALASAPADVAAVSGKIVDWEGERLDFARGVLTFDGHAFQKDFGMPLDQARIPEAGSELLFACGGNMIIRREAYLAAGGFDEDYFAYLEDVDLGWRLWQSGQRVVFTPEAVVHHRSMATSSLLGNANRGFLFERNAFLTAYKNYDDEMLARLLPAILLTLTHRTQTLMVQNNPGGEQLTFNPYAGLIANTAHPTARDTTEKAEAEQTGAPEIESEEAEGEGVADPPPATEPPPLTEPLAPADLPRIGLAEKWRAYGPREFARRGVRKAVRSVLPGWVLNDNVAPDAPRLADDRTVAQLRAVTQLLGNLDEATVRRRSVQSRRRRSDREIFDRFALHVVPTYPGDERLFASSAFKAWLGEDLPLVYASFDDIMKS